MKKYAYGQQPSDIPAKSLNLGWLAGVRHLKTQTATGSYWHTHRHIQLLYCIRGEFNYEFPDLPPTVLTAGHFIIIPAQTVHRLNEAIDPAGHRIELLIGTGREPAGYRLIPRSVAQSLIGKISRRACTSLPCSRVLASLFIEIDELSQRKEKLSPTELALARSVATLILQRCAEQRLAPKRKCAARLIGEAVAWLKAHFAEDIHVERLVDYMGYSRSWLFELFKNETGLTPADWLVRHRIKTARAMLKNSSEPVAKIARACGFSSPQYFNASFRKATGLSPSQWRASTERGRLEQSPSM
ncbi:MAG: helix-turn-helix domain-containing protein [Kiritimatiellia bacterium]